MGSFIVSYSKLVIDAGEAMKMVMKFVGTVVAVLVLPWCLIVIGCYVLKGLGI